MQMLTITRRSGEQIPINPSQVCYVRATGAMTTIYMANGELIRVGAPAGEIANAIEQALGADVGARKHVEPVGEPPMPDEAQPAQPGQPSQAPAPGAPGAPQAAEDEPTEEELAEVQGRAQRRQEADDGGHHLRAKK